MSLRTRLTLVVTAVAAIVLAVSMSVVTAEVGDRIVEDAAALELERFSDQVFTPTFARGAADGDFDDDFDGDGVDFWLDRPIGDSDVLWADIGSENIDGFGDGDFGVDSEWIDTWFFEDQDYFEKEFEVEVTFGELVELVELTREMRSQGVLDVPWEWHDLPGPGDAQGGLVALRDLSLLSVEADGSVGVVVPSKDLLLLMEEGIVRLPGVDVDRSTPIKGQPDEALESLFVDELLFSAYELLDAGEDERDEDDGPESVFLVRSDLYDNTWIPQLDRIGAVAIQAPALETALDSADIIEKVLWGAAALVLVALAGITWVMTGRALAPVRAMTSQLGEISGGNLHERVPEPGSGDEIDVLAKTMNGMLGRVERSDGERRRFVSDASHELRSPVASIRTELEVAEQFPDEADWRAVAANVATENARLETIIADLLALARFDEAESAEAVTQVDLDDVVIEEAHRPRALRVDVSAVSGGRVDGRRGELVTVVRHLLDNAVRHAVEAVAVSLVTNDDWVVLTVDDDGAGIPEGDRARIFERFTRLQESRDRDSGGAGLGLAVVDATVARHRGKVIVADSPLGGARFTVTLPAAIAP